MRCLGCSTIVQWAGLAAALLGSAAAFAHHGWSAYDQTAPLYIEGVVRTTSWDDPHAELVVDVPADVALPSDLARRTAPEQQATVDAAAILGKAVLPASAPGAWTVELARPIEMKAWGFNAPIPVGRAIAFVGYAAPGQRGPRRLRAEFVLTEGRVVPLRSSPR